MELTVDEEVRAAFPEMVSAIVGPVTLGANALAQLATEAATFKDSAQSQKSTVNLLERPSLSHWRSVYARMGASPKYDASAVSLTKVYLEKGEIWAISPVVDFYNWFSLANATPMAAYDVRQVDGDLRIRYASKGEDFVPLGRPKNPEKTKNGEVVYADQSRVVCRYWNYRDCDATKITEETTEFVFLLDLLNLPSVESPAVVLERFLASLTRIVGDRVPSRVIRFA